MQQNPKLCVRGGFFRQGSRQHRHRGAKAVVKSERCEGFKRERLDLVVSGKAISGAAGNSSG